MEAFGTATLANFSSGCPNSFFPFVHTGKVTYESPLPSPCVCLELAAGEVGRSGQPGSLKAGEEEAHPFVTFLTDTVFWEVPLG